MIFSHGIVKIDASSAKGWCQYEIGGTKGIPMHGHGQTREGTHSLSRAFYFYFFIVLFCDFHDD